MRSMWTMQWDMYLHDRQLEVTWLRSSAAANGSGYSTAPSRSWGLWKLALGGMVCCAVMMGSCTADPTPTRGSLDPPVRCLAGGSEC